MTSVTDLSHNIYIITIDTFAALLSFYMAYDNLHTFIHMYKYLYVHIMSRKMSKYTKHLGTHLLRFKLPWGMNVYSPNFYKLPTGGIHYRKWEQFLCQIWDNGHLSQYAWQYWGGTAINLCAIYDPLVQKRLRRDENRYNTVENHKICCFFVYITVNVQNTWVVLQNGQI